ncbi:MAG: hypothetical protein ACTSR8_02220 [Promethearchaeota archaeon]
MPQGVITCRWDDRLGVVLEAKYPDDIVAGLNDDDLLTIFSTHAMTESAGILSMRIKRFSIVSYYTGIPEDEAESQFFVALVLSDNENPNTYEESLTEIAKMIIDSMGKPGFEDFYIECFDRVSKMKEISEEQRYAFIFRDDVRSLLLSKLTDGSMTKEGLAKWLSKEVEREVTDIDGLLAPLVKTDLVTELNISKGKKVSLEYVFLLRDVALIRAPHIDIFKAAKSGKMDPELREKYQKSVEKFFKKYRITTQDTRAIAEFISNPDTYDIIKVLREGYMTREEIPPKIGREMPNLDRHLKRLAEENIILPVKDKKQRVWIFLLSDIQAITFFPEYMVDVIRRRWKEGTIAKEIALKHLELLRAEYISTQAPKFRKKMFDAILSNFDSAESNIKKKKLDLAASNLEVCSSQSFDMGERKLGAEFTNAAKLMREDKDKYIEEEWEKDRAKILEFFENIKKNLEQAEQKAPKKKKELDLKEKGKGPSEKAAELEAGKGKEIQKELAKAKEDFSLSDSLDKPTSPAAPKSAPKSIPKKIEKKKKVPSKPTPAPKAEPAAAPELKRQIAELENQIKGLKKQKDMVKVAETMAKLVELYKQAGDMKKAQAIYDEQNRITIETLKSLQADLIKNAKKAEKDKNWNEAARLWGECKEISSNLFKAGQMSEADKVKEFTSFEKKCRTNAEK